ncbi:MAG TPA: polysaccharide biosynthesis tyrosine autokinase [Gemmatimonadaceae bacterium]|nr:polysaccharide biosynthesis tyrosine autokinase [Gemmatimonadaceae bacterium]
MPGPIDEGYAPASAVPQQHPLDRPLAAIRRYKWLIVAVVVLATTVGVAGTRLMTPQYAVRATVWIAGSSNGDEKSGPIRSSELLNSGAWVELFRSYRIVDEVVRKLSLYLDPEKADDAPLFAGFTLANRFAPGRYQLELDNVRKAWALKTGAGVTVERGTAADSIGRKVGFLWQLPAAAFQGKSDRTVKFTVVTPREKSMELLKRVDTRLPPGSTFLWLSYEDKNPRVAAQTLNTWLAEFLSVAADLKKHNVTEFANILQGQLQYAEKATQDAEAAYQGFRVNTITMPAEGVPVAANAAGAAADRDPALMSYFEQKIEQDNIKHDREALERALASASAASAPYEGLLLIPSVAQSPGAEGLREAFKSQYALQARLRAERQNFTDEYPTVKELVTSLKVLQTQTIPQLANQLLVQLRERENDLSRRIQASGRELQQIPPRTIEERRLHRAVVVSEGLYTNLKSRYAEARLAEASATPDISVLDTAIAPLSPTKNTAPKLILFAIAGGFGAAIGLALLLDALDRKIRYSDQAASDLGLVIAGAVPRIPRSGVSTGSPEQILQFVESFRSLRMHVVHTIPGQQFTLSVTSAAPGDGKSLVSANLALSFAESGLRTVLIDGDTRRGSLNKMFGLLAKDGLTEYLAGQVQESEIVRPTAHANLSFVSCGRRNQRSPELLASPRLKQLVERLSGMFDVVIFDTPPLAAGIDAYAISAAAGRVLMVLRMGQTERRLASAKLTVLDRLPVEVLGAVLNGVQPTGEFQYYAYTPGYGIEPQETAGALSASASD